MVSDEDGDPGDDRTSDTDKEDEQDAEEPLGLTAPEKRKEDGGGEEFIDEEHESQFCLETNFTEDDDEEEETDRTPEHKDSTGEFMPRAGSLVCP